MAQDITLALGARDTYGPIQQVGADGTVLTPQNPDYSEPVITIGDPTIVSAGQTGPATYELQGLKVGTTTITATDTSSTAGDAPTIIEVLNITVTGPAAVALHGDVVPVTS
jgi:Flp pilus assembly secretin CpaC